MTYNPEKIKSNFDYNKKNFDAAYEATKQAHDDGQAPAAMYEFFVNYKTEFITRSNQARATMIKYLYHNNEIMQFLIDYAMSSYISNNLQTKLSLDEIRKYCNPNDQSLLYDKKQIIELVAIAGAWSPYWTVNMLSVNKHVKEILVESLIEERYIKNKKDQLDNSKSTHLVKLKDGKRITMSKNELVIQFDNMMRDDEAPYYIDEEYKPKHMR